MQTKFKMQSRVNADIINFENIKNVLFFVGNKYIIRYIPYEGYG